MRIGIYDPYLDDLGGGEKYMMTIASILSRNNDVYIFWDDEKAVAPLTKRFGLDLKRLKITQNIFSPNYSFSKRLSESKKYDEIIFLSNGSIPLVLSKKLFIHIQQPLKQFQKGSIKNNLKLRRVTGFFCNSEYTKSFINSRFGLKTIVLYPPVELKPKSLKKENIILHVGRFRNKVVEGSDDYKKQGVMIDVFKSMVDEGLKDWKFILAVSVNPNDEKAFDKMRQKAKNYPIEFLVNKSNDELWNIYSKSKIYWHASGYGEDLRMHPEYAEHFGISTVEAMGGGAVPVVINAGGQKEIVTSEKEGFVWDTLEELKSITLKLIGDENLMSKISSQAIKRASFFGGNRFESEVKNLFE